MIPGSRAAKYEKLRKTCLLVDDDEDDTEIFAIAMGEADPSIDCVFASDGSSALSMLENNSFVPDYIFLDLNMPQMSGKECLAEIRKRPHLSGVPVIIFSTSASQRDIDDTQELGASSFITKPPLIATLTEKLLEVVERGQVERGR